MTIGLADLVLELTRQPPDIAEDWAWLVGEGCAPVLLTAAGDLFIQKPDGAVWLVNVMDATAEPVAASLQAFRELLPSKAEAWTLPKLIAELRQQGKWLKPGQCYSLKRPLFLGGELNPDDIEPCDIAVHLSINGQLARQARHLPQGTRVRVSGPLGWVRAVARRITLIRPPLVK